MKTSSRARVKGEQAKAAIATTLESRYAAVNATEKVKGAKGAKKPKDPKELEMKELQKDIKALLGFACFPLIAC